MSDSVPATQGSSASAPPSRTFWSGLIGDLVCRAVIPIWLLTGAGFKLAERNPNLLPKPVRDIVYSLHERLPWGTTEQFLEVSMRTIIGVEFVLAAGMILLPRLSRWICLATLGLFVMILASLVWQGAASCGCFGASGPPPKVVLGIDAGLFVLAAIFGPSRRPGSVLGFLVFSAVGVALAFGVPGKSLSFEAAPEESPALLEDDPTAVTSANGDRPSGTAAPRGAAQPPSSGPPEEAPARSLDAPPGAGGAAPRIGSWPPVPARPRGFYAPRFSTWVGQPLAAQEVMHMLRRPLPAGLDEGRWHIVFYRSDCDHCAELIDNFFSGKLETRTLLVRVPDAASGRSIPNRATDVVRTELLRVGAGPDYVIGTPVVITVVDGVVKAVSERPVEDPDDLMATLQAE